MHIHARSKVEQSIEVPREVSPETVSSNGTVEPQAAPRRWSSYFEYTMASEAPAAISSAQWPRSHAGALVRTQSDLGGVLELFRATSALGVMLEQLF